MKDQRLSDLWASYRELVIAPTAGAVQVVETRRAFYAGANALLSAIMKADLQRMAALDQELRDFLRDVEDGRA